MAACHGALMHVQQHTGCRLCVRVLPSVGCRFIAIPGLKPEAGRVSRALTCFPQYPSANATFPLHIFAHGDFGGGERLLAYSGLIRPVRVPNQGQPRHLASCS